MIFTKTNLHIVKNAAPDRKGLLIHVWLIYLIILRGLVITLFAMLLNTAKINANKKK